MKKLVWLSFIVIFAMACKRRPGQVPTHGNIQWKETEISTSVSEHLDKSTHMDAPTFEHKKVENRSQASSSQKIKQELKKSLRISPNSSSMRKASQKELPPGLSNALWMTFIGLGGLLLCVLLLAFFDSTFLMFLFGIVFIVGLVSLILYKITHKKKLQ